jgi:predicted porin
MMTRGFKTTASQTIMAVTAATIIAAATNAPARAADLGGSCCGDLEERVAELEATVARKGNRVVSLQIYGQVNKALLIWDDGLDSDAYIVDNDTSGTRIGFKGEAAMRPGWKAGFNVEMDVQDAASDQVDNDTDFDDPADQIVIRMSNVYIESERLGRFTIGQQSTAGDGAAEVVLGNSLSNASLYIGNDFLVRFDDGTSTGLRLDQWLTSLDSSRDDVIRYDSPSIYGFIVSASWGDDDYADIALRYKSEWNSVRIAAAIAYQWDETGDGSLFNDQTSFGDTNSLYGSISIMHLPTGLYGALSAGNLEVDLGVNDSANYWYAQLGVERKVLPYGSTTLYGEYGRYSDFAAVFDGDALTDIGDSEVDRWGFGVVQKFDSAALEIYVQATFWSFDAVQNNGVALDLEDITTGMIGSRIKF